MAVIPAYAASLEGALGPDGAKRLQAECDAEMRAFNMIAERLYINWLQATAQI